MLSDDEVAERSDRLARAIKQREKVDQERSDAAKGYKRDLDAFAAEIKLLATCVRERREIREVECFSRVLGDGSVLIIRRDTGDVIEQQHADPGTQLRLRMSRKEPNGTEEIGEASSEDAQEA